MVLIPEMTAAISAPPRFAYAVFGISASDTPTKVETKKDSVKKFKSINAMFAALFP